MNILDKPFTLDRITRIVIFLIVAAVIIVLLNYLSSVLIPFVIAFILAYMLNPFVNLLQRLVKKRAIAVFLSLFLIFSILTGLAFLIIPLIITEFKHMATLLEQIAVENHWQDQLQKSLPPKFSKSIENIVLNQDFKSFFESQNLSEALSFLFNKFLPGITDVFSQTINIILGIFGFAIVLLYLIFILLQYDKVTMEWRDMIPPKYKTRVLKLLTDFELAMSNYFRAQAVIASIDAALFAIGFTIIGLPMGIVLGLFFGILCMIPYMQNLGLIPAMFFALMKSLESDTSFGSIAIMVLIVFAVVQVVQETILTPRIMGNATGMNAVLILLSLSIWGKLLGMLGLLIALPVSYLMLSYYRTYILSSSFFSELPVDDKANPIT